MKKIFYLLFCSAVVNYTSNGQAVFKGDINSGTSSSFPSLMTPFNSKLYMMATTTATGNEIFSYDGSSAPSLVYDIIPGATSGVGSSGTFTYIAVAGDFLYFSGNADGMGMELTKIGFSGAPVRAGNDINPGTGYASPRTITELNGKIYFSAYNPTTGNELYVYNPATDVSTLLVDLTPGTGSASPDDLLTYKGKLYFSASTASLGRELYSYDPVTNASTLVMDINAGTPSSGPSNLIIMDDKIYFIAATAANGRELFRYDGSAVTRCTDVKAGTDNGVSNVKPIGYENKVYFNGYDATNQTQLFSYDPATNATTLVYTFDPVSGGYPYQFNTYGGKLYFQARDAANGFELWETNGTTTKMVQDINPGVSSSSPSGLTVWNGKMYFSAFTPTYGTEFYELSTPEGLGLKDIVFKGSVILAPNPTNADIRLLLNLEETQTLQISVSDMSGRQLYQTAANLYHSGAQEIMLPVSQYPAGNYFYKIMDDNGKILMNGKMSKL